MAAGLPEGAVEAAEVDAERAEEVARAVAGADVVASLLPAGAHAAVARECVALGRHLVTASYVGKEMEELDEAARGAGVVLLCELGLDPGIDHMIAMRMIRDVRARGGQHALRPPPS